MEFVRNCFVNVRLNINILMMSSAMLRTDARFKTPQGTSDLGMQTKAGQPVLKPITPATGSLLFSNMKEYLCLGCNSNQ